MESWRPMCNRICSLKNPKSPFTLQINAWWEGKGLVKRIILNNPKTNLNMPRGKFNRLFMRGKAFGAD